MVYSDETLNERLSESEMKELMDSYFDLNAELREAGQMKGSAALQPTETATTVAVRDGKTITTDGPYAETKEQLGGYYLVDARDLDEAIRIATRIPAASSGSVEVRPVWDLSEFS